MHPSAGGWGLGVNGEGSWAWRPREEVGDRVKEAEGAKFGGVRRFLESPRDLPSALGTQTCVRCLLYSWRFKFKEVSKINNNNKIIVGLRVLKVYDRCEGGDPSPLLRGVPLFYPHPTDGPSEAEGVRQMTTPQGPPSHPQPREGLPRGRLRGRTSGGRR